MPKGKRNGKSDRGRYERSLSSSEDESDNISVISYVSESKNTDGSDVPEEFAQEQFEDKMLEVLDGLAEKSSKTRTTNLQALKKALVKKYVPCFVRDRHFTICDGIEKGLKKGSDEEKSAAAELAPLVCVQLGEEEAEEIVNKALRPILLLMVADKTVDPNVRAKCCSALGMLVFLSNGEMADTIALMQTFETIFSGSYLKGDGAIPNVTATVANLHATALSAWTLLLTNLPPANLNDFITSKTLPSLYQLAQLLESIHLEVRMSAGEALALIVEKSRASSYDFTEDFSLEITETFKKLATDSNKYRAKKDRKQQRATFRDILHFIEDDLVSDVQVKFSGEALVLDTWSRRKQYDAFCAVLGPGINIHLTENDLLRDIFEIMSSPMLSETTNAHAQQMERNRKRLVNAAAFKARTISRGKNRDKRSDF